ncbi:unnamed protein product [Calypogeia fissa]
MLVLSIEEEESAYALQFFGLKGENLPAYVIQTDKGEKYVSKNAKPEQLAPWLDDFLADKLKVHIKSEPVPLFNDQPVKVVVADSFKEVVIEAGKDAQGEEREKSEIIPMPIKKGSVKRLKKSKPTNKVQDLDDHILLPDLDGKLDKSNETKNISSKFQVGDHVKLKDDTKKTSVAYGRIDATGGSGAMFHGKVIELGFVRIMIEKVYVPKYELPFPDLNDDPPQEFVKDPISNWCLWAEDSLSV